MVDALTANIVFDSGMGRVGPERIALLDAIAQSGSIGGAGKLLDMSYRSCWDSVQALNNLFGEPLITTIPGGQANRGAALTEAGVLLLADYRELQQEMAEVVSRLRARLGGRADRVATLPLVSVRSTARNVWRAVISSLDQGPIVAEVGLELAPGLTLIGSVPVRNFEDLALQQGSSVLALVNPNSVILCWPDMPRTTARNQLTGTVIRREDTPVGSEITLDLGGGKTLFSTIGPQSAAELDFQEGDAACALIKAAQVTLFAT